MEVDNVFSGVSSPPHFNQHPFLRSLLLSIGLLSTAMSKTASICGMPTTGEARP